MHISELTARRFRRFTDLAIRILGSPRLVVLCGPNGSGKSSLFDAMRLWHGFQSTLGVDHDPGYWVKGGGAVDGNQVTLTFHEANDISHGTAAARKAVYIRTAYRNDPAFEISQIQRAGPRQARQVTRRVPPRQQLRTQRVPAVVRSGNALGALWLPSGATDVLDTAA